MILGLGAALGAAVVFGVAAVLQAVGSRRVPTESEVDPRHLARFVGGLLRQPAFVAALVLNLLGFGLHLIALRALPLYLAQAGIAASLAVTALLATRVVGDRLSAVEWTAVAGVCAGLGLLAVSAGDAGESARPDHRLTVGLVVGLVLIAALGLLASRSTHGVATAVLGLLAGSGFAGVAVSARLLPEIGVDALRTPAAYTLVVSGALAFLLYSLALQRGSVAVATAPMIVMQTLTPAAVGVLLLGDQIHPGWSAGATAGFLLSAAGSLILVRFERIRDHPEPGRAAG